MEDLVARLHTSANQNHEMLGDIHLLLTEAAEEIERLRYDHEIVARIWKMLDSPTYSQLGGRDIFDLIRELQQKAK